MEFKRLKKELAAEARQDGICRQWHEKILHAPSKEYLLGLFVKGSDFAMLNSYPSERLRREFDDLAPHCGVYLHGRHTANNRRNVMALGASEVTATYDGCGVGDAIAADQARLAVGATGHAYVSVEVRGLAEVEARASGNAKVLIMKHGGAVHTEASGHAEIKVIDKTATA